jgi:prepilin-type N-terminal cleavage/methylation domain-containing protein
VQEVNALTDNTLTDNEMTAPFLPQTSAMKVRPILWHARQSRGGFTLVEMVFAFAIIGILSLMMIPRIQRSMQSHQTRRAAIQISGDVERAFTLAGRYRRPMRLTINTANATYTVADRNGGTVRMSRDLRNGGDLGTMTLAASVNGTPVTQLDIFPSGISTSLDTISVSSGGSTRRIVVTTAGQVRIVP